MQEMTVEDLRCVIAARGIALPEGGVVTDNDETLSEKDSLVVTIRAAGPRPVIHCFWVNFTGNRKHPQAVISNHKQSQAVARDMERF